MQAIGRIALRISLAAAGPAFFVLATGYLIPRGYEGSAILDVQAPPEAVWAVLEDAGAYPGWRSDVESAEVPPGADGAWREIHRGGGATRHEALPERPPEKFRDRFTAEGRPGRRGVDGGAPAARGERVFLMVVDAEGRTRISITEKGEIDGPWDRFRARFVDGYHSVPRRLAEDLRKRLGE